LTAGPGEFEQGFLAESAEHRCGSQRFGSLTIIHPGHGGVTVGSVVAGCIDEE
jgi:hypothetical protein